MYKLTVKLDELKPTISRTVCVPEDITFIKLNDILSTVFDFSSLHLSVFNFPGLNAPLWDYKRCYPDSAAMDMNDILISEYLSLFKKFNWTYDLGHSYEFTIKVTKTKADKDYPFVEAFECECNPIEDCSPYDFEEMMYCYLNNQKYFDYLPDFEMEIFDIEKVNRNLKKLF